jgi:hypothetical protein
MNKINLRIIVYALLVWLILNGFLYLYNVNDFPFSPDISNFLFVSIILISHFSLALAAGTMIVVWICTFTTKMPFTHLTVAGLIGCAICFYNVVIPLINHKYIGAIESLLMEPARHADLSHLSVMINDKNIPLERRSIVSYAMAKDKYTNSGVLSEFINEKGETHVYSPSKSEIETREQMVRSRIEAFNNLKVAKNIIYFQIIFWPLVFIFSIGFSLVRRRNI